ncbi:hypothetical protein LCGC14_1051280, partial [marine sediment metagenome]
MKRRKFLNHSMLAGLASLSEASSTMAQASTKDASIYNKYHDPARMLKLEGEYYRHYPVDFSLGGEGAHGFKGWGKSAETVVPAEETAIIPMHIWNDGSPELPFSPDGPAGRVMNMYEMVS